MSKFSLSAVLFAVFALVAVALTASMTSAQVRKQVAPDANGTPLPPPPKAQSRPLAAEPEASRAGGEASAQLAAEGVRFAPPSHYTGWECKVTPSKSGGAPYLSCWASDPHKVASIFVVVSANEVSTIQRSMLVIIKAASPGLVPIGAQQVGAWDVTHYTLGSGYNPQRISIGIRRVGGKNSVFMVYNDRGYPADIRAEAEKIFALSR